MFLDEMSVMQVGSNTKVAFVDSISVSGLMKKVSSLVVFISKK